MLDLLLPQCLERDDRLSIRAIRQLYSKAEIDRYLDDALSSVVCTSDTTARLGYRSVYDSDTDTERLDSFTYYAATATMRLFGRLITMPDPSSPEGARPDRDSFVAAFRESSFYRGLKD